MIATYAWQRSIRETVYILGQSFPRQEGWDEELTHKMINQSAFMRISLKVVGEYTRGTLMTAMHRMTNGYPQMGQATLMLTLGSWAIASRDLR